MSGLKRIGKKTLISKGNAFGGVGAVVRDADRRLHLVVCAHLLPGWLRVGDDCSLVGQDGCAPVPDEVVREDECKSAIAGMRLLAVPDGFLLDHELLMPAHKSIHDIGAHEAVTMHAGGLVYSGTMVSFHSSFVSVEDDGTEHRFFGATGVKYERAVDINTIRIHTGSPVVAESGELIGFMIATTGAKWMMASAEALFLAYGVCLANEDDVSKHNRMLEDAQRREGLGGSNKKEPDAEYTLHYEGLRPVVVAENSHLLTMSAKNRALIGSCSAAAPFGSKGLEEFQQDVGGGGNSGAGYKNVHAAQAMH